MDHQASDKLLSIKAMEERLFNLIEAEKKVMPDEERKHLKAQIDFLQIEYSLTHI